MIWAVIAISAVLGLSSSPQFVVVNGDTISVSESLLGTAYFMTCGPSEKAEIESDLVSHMIGRRALRVTFFRCEMDRLILVEEIFYNQRGGAKVQWGAYLPEHRLYESFATVAKFTSENLRWIDATTFALDDDEPWIDPSTGELVVHRRTQVRSLGGGDFEISGGELKRPRTDYDDG